MTKHFSSVITRRALLRSGAIMAAAMMIGRRTSFAAPAAPAKAQAVIQLWLAGGPCHIDTFDPKPEAGSSYCGPLSTPIETNVPGIKICELLPELAKQADKYSIIRSMTHGSNGHETAAYMVQTGHAEGDRLVYPSIGAVVSLLKGYDAGYKEILPPYFVLTEPQGRFSEAGFLGPRYKPFATGGDPSRVPFAVQGIIADGITEKRQVARRDLLHNLDTFGSAMKSDPKLAEFDRCGDAAYDMILGDGAKIFDLTQEGDPMRDSYGRNRFGQSCLAARRLVERGTKFVTINFGGWDTHKQHFQAMRQKLPELDKGVAALLQDLSSRGLLESTIVWVGGEFGRTPKIQQEAPWNGGRGHHGEVFSMLVAGGGFHGGQVVGSSDATGEEVVTRPVYPWDLIGSMYELLGIDPDSPFPRMGDPNVRLIQPIAGSIKSGGRLKEIM